MANPVCTDYVTGNGCFGSHTLNPKQKKAILIFLMVKELSGLGGTDYSLTEATTLVSDAPCTLTPDDIEAARIGIQLTNAVKAGYAGATDVSTLLAKSLCLTKVPDRKLDQIILMLTCKLGIHGAFPQ